jgi:hypothetical protein
MIGDFMTKPTQGSLLFKKFRELIMGVTNTPTQQVKMPLH